MLKIVCLFNFRDEVDREVASAHWQEKHPDVVRRCVPGAVRYVQNLAIHRSGRRWPYDAVSELWFADMDAIKTAYGSPALVAERVADEVEFMTDEYEWLIAEEKVCW